VTTLREYVLVVDDDDAIRETVSEILADEGYAVRSAANGDQALHLIRTTTPPCLILLDLMMPVMNGWQFAAVAVADPDLARVPICVMTASDMAQVAPTGVVEVARKPLHLDHLLRMVARFGAAARGVRSTKATRDRRAV
jgi:CheY-like chemotaxis protein